MTKPCNRVVIQIAMRDFQVSRERSLFYGKAMLILRTQPGQKGKIRVTASSDGLASAQTVVQCQLVK